MPIDQFLASHFEVRFILYGFLGFIFEVFFTAVSDLISPQFLCSWNVHTQNHITNTRPDWRAKRDVRLVGYSFLWMFPVYGLLVFLEPVSYLIQNWPWFLRGLFYGVSFSSVEALTGWLIKKISGRCPWDYSYHRLSIAGYTRYDFVLVWFITGLFLEALMPVWIELTPAILQAFSHVLHTS